MSIHAAIIDRLKTDAAIVAIVGDNIFPESAPSGQSVPYVTVHVPSDTPWRHSSGMSGVKEADIDVQIVANSLGELHPISKAIEARLPLFDYESRCGVRFKVSLDEAMTTDPVYRQGGQERHLLLRTIPATAFYTDE